MGRIVKRYMAAMVARGLIALKEKAQGAQRLQPATEAVAFPTRDKVLRRWNRVKGKLHVKNPAMWTPASIPNFDWYREVITDRQEQVKFADALAEVKLYAYGSTARKAASALGRELWTSQETIAAIRSKTLKIVTTKITPDLRNELVLRLEKAINAGFTIDETAHSLGFLNTNWRTIAKTETFDVMNIGARDQVANEAQEYGSEIEKWWQHSGNSNGRPSHMLAADMYGEDNPIPMDEPFIVDGESMQHPHDPNASAGNVVNCGCTVCYRVKQSA